MIVRLCRRAAGEVRICVTGASLTRFLNACAEGGIELRQMERVEWNRLEASVSVRDFRHLPSCMGRTGCRVRILERRGLPFVLARLLPRTVLLCGLAAFCVLVALVGTRVWEIRTDISPSLDRDAVMEKLEELGVGIGTPLRAINTPSIRRQMMIWEPEISFFALNLRGNSLTVTAHAGVQPPETAHENEVASIVAKQDGVIKSIEALRGASMVAAGDAVHKGDVLIDGCVLPTREGGKAHFVRSDGRVYAYTRRSVKAVRPLKRTEKRFTGKTKTRLGLCIAFRGKNYFVGRRISGGECEKTIERRVWQISESVRFPVSLEVQTYRYYEPVPCIRTAEDERTEMLRLALGQTAADMEDGKILSFDAEMQEKNGAALLTLAVHAEEQIGERIAGR